MWTATSFYEERMKLLESQARKNSKYKKKPSSNPFLIDVNRLFGWASPDVESEGPKNRNTTGASWASSGAATQSLSDPPCVESETGKRKPPPSEDHLFFSTIDPYFLESTTAS